jgi:hypothetical protein
VVDMAFQFVKVKYVPYRKGIITTVKNRIVAGPAKIKNNPMFLK